MVISGHCGADPRPDKGVDFGLPGECLKGEVEGVRSRRGSLYGYTQLTTCESKQRQNLIPASYKSIPVSTNAKS